MKSSGHSRIHRDSRLSRRNFLRLLGGIPLLAEVGADASSSAYLLQGRVLDGTGRVFDPGRVLVRGGFIEQVGPAGSLEPGSDQELLFHPSATILPGVVNAHVHLTDKERDAASRRDVFLRAGVTTLGDVGSPRSAMADLLDHEHSARVVCCGPMLCAPGGYPQPLHGERWGFAVSSPREGRQAVARLQNAGAGMVKISFDRGPLGKWPLLDADTVAAIIVGARARSMPVRCHVEDLEGMELAVRAGVDVVEHVPMRGKGVFTGEQGKREPCMAYCELIAAMAHAGILWCPTLDVGSRSAWDDSGQAAAVRVFVEAGGKVVLGTDYPFRGVEGGLPLREMELLSNCGLTGHDVIRAATAHAALALGRDDVGILAAGMRADILVVQGDLRQDIHALGSALAVFKGGALEMGRTSG